MSAKRQRVKSSAHCPLPNTHSRLNQAHLLWHQTVEAYDDPEGFRANLNATIEALRNVTFMLQKEKRVVPDFDTWYDEWRRKMKADPVMTWLGEARTIIVHTSDLETQSTAHATVHTNLPLARISVDLPPFLPFADACELIESTLPEPFASNKINLVLSIERRWVAKQLPEWELLDALAHAYGVLSTMLKEAHERAGFDFEATPSGDECTISPDGRLSCMITTAEARTARFSLDDGTALVSRKRPIHIKSQHINKAKERYRLERFKSPLPKDADPFQVAESILPLAKEMLQRDKHHIRIMFLRTPKHWTMLQINARDREEKYALMRTVANEIRKLQIDALIEISEAWGSSVREFKSGRLPEDAHDKKEALMMTVATSEGKCRQYVTIFKRDALGQIRLGKTKVTSLIPFYLAPILEVWGLPLPSAEDNRTD